jgi:hypothetical protein
MMDRGLRASVPEQVDDDGVVTAPVTYETAPRGYFSYWKTLMERDADVPSSTAERNGVAVDA